MPSRAEIVLKWTAALAAVLALGCLGLTIAGVPAAFWPALALLYLTGVSYGLAEMTRLFQRHRRRCPQCLAGVGLHLRWWLPRVAMVVLVALLPVLLLLPVAAGMQD